MTTPEAALEAIRDAPCLYGGTGPSACTWRIWTHPKCALAALVESEAVREGLVETVQDSVAAWFLEPDDPGNSTGSKGFRPWPLVDAILAALRPQGAYK